MSSALVLVTACVVAMLSTSVWAQAATTTTDGSTSTTATIPTTVSSVPDTSVGQLFFFFFSLNNAKTNNFFVFSFKIFNMKVWRHNFERERAMRFGKEKLEFLFHSAGHSLNTTILEGHGLYARLHMW
jgi:hypothetical protein